LADGSELLLQFNLPIPVGVGQGGNPLGEPRVLRVQAGQGGVSLVEASGGSAHGCLGGVPVAEELIAFAAQPLPVGVRRFQGRLGAAAGDDGPPHARAPDPGCAAAGQPPDGSSSTNSASMAPSSSSASCCVWPISGADGTGTAGACCSAATSACARSCSRMYSALVGTHFVSRCAAVFIHMASSCFCHGEYGESEPCDMALAFFTCARFRTTTFDVAPSFMIA